MTEQDKQEKTIEAFHILMSLCHDNRFYGEFMLPGVDPTEHLFACIDKRDWVDDLYIDYETIGG